MKKKKSEEKIETPNVFPMSACQNMKSLIKKTKTPSLGGRDFPRPAEECDHGSLLGPHLIGTGQQKTLDHMEYDFPLNGFTKRPFNKSCLLKLQSVLKGSSGPGAPSHHEAGSKRPCSPQLPLVWRHTQVHMSPSLSKNTTPFLDSCIAH